MAVKLLRPIPRTRELLDTRSLDGIRVCGDPIEIVQCANLLLQERLSEVPLLLCGDRPVVRLLKIIGMDPHDLIHGYDQPVDREMGIAPGKLLSCLLAHTAVHVSAKLLIPGAGIQPVDELHGGPSLLHAFCRIEDHRISIFLKRLVPRSHVPGKGFFHRIGRVLVIDEEGPIIQPVGNRPEHHLIARNEGGQFIAPIVSIPDFVLFQGRMILQHLSISRYPRDPHLQIIRVFTAERHIHALFNLFVIGRPVASLNLIRHNSSPFAIPSRLESFLLFRMAGIAAAQDSPNPLNDGYILIYA